MALLNNPVSIEIVRGNGALQVIDIIPIYEETAHAFVATNALRIYEGYPPGDMEGADQQNQRDRYMQYIDLYGADNPLFLGEIHLHGEALVDWVYHGNRLTEAEIWQIVGLLIAFTNESGIEEEAIDAILQNADELPEGFAFVYNNGFETHVVRIEEAEGHFMILIDEQLTAQIEMPDEVWEVTGGEIADPELLDEILQRIRAATA